MVRIGEVWDRTTAVLSGRPAMLAGIAFMTLVLPDLVRNAVALVLPAGAFAALVALILALAAIALAILGQIALVAASSDPSVGQRDAYAIGRSRFWPAIGVVVVLGVIGIILALPLLALFVAMGLQFASDGTIVAPTAPAVGAAGGVLLYGLFLGIATLVVGARLMTLWPVVTHERRGLGAFARAWGMTKGMTLRLIGVFLLWCLLLGVIVLAVVSVVGTITAIVFGAGSPVAAFIVALVTSLIGAGAAIVQAAFTAQLYRAIVGHREPAMDADHTA